MAVFQEPSHEVARNLPAHKNLAGRIREILPNPVLAIIEAAGQAASRSQQHLYLVGGIVRDLLLGRESRDIDIMAQRDGLTIAKALSASLGARPVVHRAFGTATFETGGYRFDISTCRSETYRHPGALPSVMPGSISQDLLRRDFTINAMAAAINPGNFGVITDLFGGRVDLEAGLVRILHDGSFADDATRMIRAVRYEQRLGFRLERRTSRLLRRDLDMLDTIGGERLRREVMLWFEEPHPGKILKRAANLGILKKFDASLSWNAMLGRAFRSAGKSTAGIPPSLLYFCLLAYPLDGRQLDRLLRRLKVNGGELKDAAQQTLALKSNLGLFAEPALKHSLVYDLACGFHPAAIQANRLLAASAAVRSKLGLYLDKLRFIKVRLTGSQLGAMGVPPGRSIGITLDKLLKARLDGLAVTKKDEERLVKGWLDKVS